MRVVYTDPAWALDADGRPDPALAAVERSVLGPDADIELGLFEDSYVTSGDRFLKFVRGADALVIYRCQVTPELVDAVSPGCKVVARSGVGVDNLNAPLLARTGIIGFNVPDYCGDEVSTHTLALLLALERGSVSRTVWCGRTGGASTAAASRAVPRLAPWGSSASAASAAPLPANSRRSTARCSPWTPMSTPT